MMKKFLENSDFKILYLGTAEMSANLLEGLIQSGFNIAGVITKIDTYTGRKHLLTEPLCKQVARKYNIPCFQPEKLKDGYSFLDGISFDVILTFSYGKIVPESFLKLAPYGAVNVHGSLLPKYRGAAPIQRAIMNGDKVTGVTLMQMVKKMDAGLMYKKMEIEIKDDDNYTSLCDKMWRTGLTLVKENLLPYMNGELPGEVQDESLVTFANKITPEDEKLDLTQSVDRIFNHIRGLSYTPGAFIYYGETPLKILKTEKERGYCCDIPCLTVQHKDLYLSLKDGSLKILELQEAGKKKQTGKDFINGHRGTFLPIK